MPSWNATVLPLQLGTSSPGGFLTAMTNKVFRSRTFPQCSIRCAQFCSWEGNTFESIVRLGFCFVCHYFVLGILFIYCCWNECRSCLTLFDGPECSGVDPVPMTTKVYYLRHHHRMRAVLGSLFQEACGRDTSCSPSASPNSLSIEQGAPAMTLPALSLDNCVLDSSQQQRGGQSMASDKVRCTSSKFPSWWLQIHHFSFNLELYPFRVLVRDVCCSLSEVEVFSVACWSRVRSFLCLSQKNWYSRCFAMSERDPF